MNLIILILSLSPWFGWKRGGEMKKERRTEWFLWRIENDYERETFSSCLSILFLFFPEIGKRRKRMEIDNNWMKREWVDGKKREWVNWGVNSFFVLNGITHWEKRKKKEKEEKEREGKRKKEESEVTDSTIQLFSSVHIQFDSSYSSPKFSSSLFFPSFHPLWRERERLRGRERKGEREGEENQKRGWEESCVQMQRHWLQPLRIIPFLSSFWRERKKEIKNENEGEEKESER